MSVVIDNLRFRYRNAKVDTIKDFSIEIETGKILSILGQSGSGKSTVLRLVSGLEEPIEGKIQIDNKIIVDDKEFILPENRGIGMVFQDYALFPHMTVSQNIKFGLKKLNKKEKENRVKEFLKLVNLKEYGDRYPYELSGGQQQRVALARALAPKPSLLLLDEPFSNLDADLQIKIRDELKSIIKKTGTTSIFVTHDKEDSLAIADKVIVLKDGVIEKEGEPDQILL
ncbi:hypothetical protein SH2C18_13930 [Clostridium sediminicola]|uniref:ABC transporter ATP-binding protein n=1 Tax=Clostridium sediminicola TaxID=3114879 RepID=UPI0031F25B36